MASPAITVTHFTDPHCPWAYSASPALALLRWRFGDQLEWKLRLIGLAESADRYEAAGWTPERMAAGYEMFRRWGMPFATEPRERLTGTGFACRVVVAARLRAPGSELKVFRTLQLAQFTTTLLLDTDDGVLTALERLGDEVDAKALVEAAHDDPEVEAAYRRDREAARRAAGTPTEAQGKAAVAEDGRVRYTAPSLIFTTSDGRSLEAGGFQTVEAYDVVIANLDPTLERRPPATDPVEVVRALPLAPTTREVAVCMAPPFTDPDDEACERALQEAAEEGKVVREEIADRTIWHPAG